MLRGSGFDLEARLGQGTRQRMADALAGARDQGRAAAEIADVEELGIRGSGEVRTHGDGGAHNGVVNAAASSAGDRSMTSAQGGGRDFAVAGVQLRATPSRRSNHSP